MLRMNAFQFLLTGGADLHELLGPPQFAVVRVQHGGGRHIACPRFRQFRAVDLSEGLPFSDAITELHGDSRHATGYERRHRDLPIRVRRDNTGESQGGCGWGR